MIIKLEDLLTWIADASDWHWGLSSVWTKQTASTADTKPIKIEEPIVGQDASATATTEPAADRKINGSINEIECHRENYIKQNKTNSLEDCSAIDYSDVLKEKAQLG